MSLEYLGMKLILSLNLSARYFASLSVGADLEERMCLMLMPDLWVLGRSCNKRPVPLNFVLNQVVTSLRWIGKVLPGSTVGSCLGVFKNRGGVDRRIQVC